MERQTIQELVNEFDHLGGETAYVFRRGYRTERWSYADVARTARQFAWKLQERKLQRGDAVLLWAENCAEWVAAFFGCALFGAVAVPVDRAATPEFVLLIVREMKARVAVCSRDVASKLPGITTLTVEDLREELSRYPIEFQPATASRTDTLQVVFTSGTTAEPKGVVLSHGNILANLAPLEREIAKYKCCERIFHPLRFLDLLPLSHVFGQLLGLFVPQALGATVVFQESLNPAEVIKTIRRERISVCLAVPHILESLRMQVTNTIGADFGHRFTSANKRHFTRRMWMFRDVHHDFGWKFWAFISGGAALDEATETFWGRLGFAVIQGYGLTETTSLISVNHPFRSGKRSIGKPLPGCEMKLAEDGEILVRGENIARNYMQAGTLNPVLGDEDWFHTGDLGEVDTTGNLYFKGRKKNVFVTSAGMNVYPQDIESTLRRDQRVRDAVVIGISVDGNTEPSAVLLLNHADDAGDVVRSANKQLAEYQQIRHWAVWRGADLPRTSTGKPKINELEAFAAGNQGSISNDVSSIVSRLFSRDTGTSTPAAGLEDELNLSSLQRVELLAELENRYQITLDENRFANSKTIADVQQALAESGPEITQYAYPSWPQRWPYTWIRNAVYACITWPATMLMAKPRVTGRENLSSTHGTMLIACNHVTYIDVGFVLAALPWRMKFRLAVGMIGQRLMEMRTPPKERAIFTRAAHRIAYELLIGLFNVFPLPQRAGFRESFRFAGQSVDRGYSILVFPEGRRTADGSLQKFQVGIGMLATGLRIPVLPMRIDGLWNAAQNKQHFVQPHQIHVRIGKPVQYNASDNPGSIAQDIERRIRELQ